MLESYKTIKLSYMADTFGVTEDYIDGELCRFIAGGRLHAKIDKVGGIVVTCRPDSKNGQYQNCIKQGDILLNRSVGVLAVSQLTSLTCRVQKLSRVINI